MIEWHGTSSKTSPVDSTVGISDYQQNTRLKIMGECQRRSGMIPSGNPNAGGRILMIASAIRGNFLTFGIDGGDVQGYSPLPDPQIDGPKWRKPPVVVGNPVAPVINNVIPFPPSPAPYGIGPVTFSPNFTYDNLSGPLIWLWNPNSGGPGSPVPISTNTVLGIFDFNGFCIPGNYLNFSVQATTTVGGLVSNQFFFNFTIA